MLDTLYKIQVLIREITGDTYTLAGGCVRDASVGVVPKDYDAVLCCGTISDAEAFAKLEAHAKAFARHIPGTYVEIYMAYGQGNDGTLDGFAERLYACGEVKLPDGLEIDLLLDRADTMDKAVAGYDCNMNKVYLTSRGASQELPAELVFSSGRITSQARDLYMREKFERLTSKRS